MTSAFSSSDTAALEKQPDLVDAEAEVTLQQIWNEEQSNKCIEWIKANQYKRVRD